MTSSKRFLRQIGLFFDENVGKLVVALYVIVGVAIFIGAFIIAGNKFLQPTTESNLVYYEQVARDVYEQGDNNIIEVPEGVSVTRDTTEITVSGQGIDKVVAKLKNGKLVCTRVIIGNTEKNLRKSFFGILALFIIALAYICVCGIACGIFMVYIRMKSFVKKLILIYLKK